MKQCDMGMPTLIELKTAEENIQLCERLGLQFVELNMNLPQYQLSQLEQIERWEQLANKYHVYYTIHLDENLNVADFNPLVSLAYVETVLRTIEVAKQLKIPVLNMHMNHGVYFTLPQEKVYLFEQYEEDYLNAMRTFQIECERAIGSSDMKICIENTNGYHSYEQRAVELLLTSSVFALTWDIGHSHACGDQDEAFLMKHEEKLAHFHIHDARGKSDHLQLGTGDICLQQRLELAQQKGARLVLEVKTKETLQKSVEWISE